MPASVQARIARVARDGEVRIDGAPTATNMRWIGSAAPGIEADVHANRFRGDLFRRLTASRIDLPSLRDRAEDVPALATRLLEDWCAAHACAPRSFTQPAVTLLSALTWPRNLAELHVVIDRAATNTPHDVIQIEDLLPALNLDRIDRMPEKPRRMLAKLKVIEPVLHFRSPTMTATKLEGFARQSDMQCIAQELVPWGGRTAFSDCLSTIVKRSSSRVRENRLFRNPHFMKEAQYLSRLSHLYGPASDTVMSHT